MAEKPKSILQNRVDRLLISDQVMLATNALDVFEQVRNTYSPSNSVLQRLEKAKAEKWVNWDPSANTGRKIPEPLEDRVELAWA